MGALYVRLGETRYRIERPWGDLPQAGRITDVACDSRGHVFVLFRGDPYAGDGIPAVVELAPDGSRRAAWGEGVVADAHMLGIDGDDVVHVVDRGAHEIIRFSRDGERLGGLGHRHYPGEPFNAPCDVAFAASGEMFVADGYGGSRVHRFGADGRLIGSWGTTGDGPGEFLTPHGIAVLADQRVLVADRDNGRLQLFTPDGGFLAIWSGYDKPMDIYVDGTGRIFVVDQVPSVTALAADGTRLGRASAVVERAHGIWGDSRGRLYLAEGKPSRITRLVPI